MGEKHCYIYNNVYICNKFNIHSPFSLDKETII